MGVDPFRNVPDQFQDQATYPIPSDPHIGFDYIGHLKHTDIARAVARRVAAKIFIFLSYFLLCSMEHSKVAFEFIKYDFASRVGGVSMK